MNQTGWSEHAWHAVSDWYHAILQHPFLAALGDGTLAEDVFARYLVDDAHYLAGYARALSALASRTGEPDAAAMLASSAAQGIRA
ncbi:MAG: thiaminase II, partial [Nocardioidaceae bacterium]